MKNHDDHDQDLRIEWTFTDELTELVDALDDLLTGIDLGGADPLDRREVEKTLPALRKEIAAARGSCEARGLRGALEKVGRHAAWLESTIRRLHRRGVLPIAKAREAAELFALLATALQEERATVRVIDARATGAADVAATARAGAPADAAGPTPAAAPQDATVADEPPSPRGAPRAATRRSSHAAPGGAVTGTTAAVTPTLDEAAAVEASG